MAQSKLGLVLQFNCGFFRVAMMETCFPSKPTLKDKEEKGKTPKNASKQESGDSTVLPAVSEQQGVVGQVSTIQTPDPMT